MREVSLIRRTQGFLGAEVKGVGEGLCLRVNMESLFLSAGWHCVSEGVYAEREGLKKFRGRDGFCR